MHGSPDDRIAELLAGQQETATLVSLAYWLSMWVRSAYGRGPAEASHDRAWLPAVNEMMLIVIKQIRSIPTGTPAYPAALVPSLLRERARLQSLQAMLDDVFARVAAEVVPEQPSGQ